MNTPTLPVLTGTAVTLRPITDADTDLIVKWRNTPSVVQNFIFRQTFTPEMHRSWLATKVATGQVVQYIIVDKADGKPVGSVYYRDIDNHNRSAEYGIFIGEESARGKGLGTETARLFTQFGVDTLHLHRISLRVLAENTPARRSYAAAGFGGEALALLDAARAKLADYPYATIGLYGRQSPLVVFRAATAEPLDDSAIAELDSVFGLADEAGAIVYADRTRHIAKKAVAEAGRLVGVRLSGESLAQGWLKQAMAENELDAGLIRFALAPSSKPPRNMAPRNIVCKCADASDVQIGQQLAAGGNLKTLQEKLKCGTYCGACLPEIKRMVAEYAPTEAAAA